MSHKLITGLARGGGGGGAGDSKVYGKVYGSMGLWAFLGGQ